MLTMIRPLTGFFPNLFNFEDSPIVAHEKNCRRKAKDQEITWSSPDKNKTREQGLGEDIEERQE